MSSAKDGLVTTTEDNKARDKGALDVVAQALGVSVAVAGAAFAALAAEGYSVVKTRSDEWEYGFVFDSDAHTANANDWGTFLTAEDARAEADVHVIDAADSFRIYRRHPTPILDDLPWEPVPESSTLGGSANG